MNLRVPAQNLSDFTLFDIDSKRLNWPAASCAWTANAISRYTGIYSTMKSLVFLKYVKSITLIKGTTICCVYIVISDSFIVLHVLCLRLIILCIFLMFLCCLYNCPSGSCVSTLTVRIWTALYSIYIYISDKAKVAEDYSWHYCLVYLEDLTRVSNLTKDYHGSS